MLQSCFWPILLLAWIYKHSLSLLSRSKNDHKLTLIYFKFFSWTCCTQMNMLFLLLPSMDDCSHLIYSESLLWPASAPFFSLSKPHDTTSHSGLHYFVCVSAKDSRSFESSIFPEYIWLVHKCIVHNWYEISVFKWLVIKSN